MIKCLDLFKRKTTEKEKENFSFRLQEKFQNKFKDKYIETLKKKKKKVRAQGKLQENQLNNLQKIKRMIIKKKTTAKNVIICFNNNKNFKNCLRLENVSTSAAKLENREVGGVGRNQGAPCIIPICKDYRNCTEVVSVTFKYHQAK